MQLLDLLPPDHVVVPLQADDLRDAIGLLVGRLEECGSIEPSTELRQRIAKEPLREAIAITDDVLLPHYRAPHIHSLLIALGIATRPIPSGDPALDIQPRIVALVLAPNDAPALYLQATATLARLLRRPGTVEALVRQTSAHDVLALPDLQNLPLRPTLAVRDIMRHRIHSVPPDADLRSTIDLMLRRRLRAVPVVGPKGEVLGMVTDSDLMRTLLPQIPRATSDEGARDSPVLDRPVKEIMTRSVLCVSEDLGVGEVANMMIHKDVEQVPVVRAGAITGIVSRGDIIRKLFATE
jgi:CBS domain-containing protein/mannitol/fructose-specific phosphotransferase system IIA component (Ntr-type)